MTIICEDLSELKLLVESIDLTRISDSPRFDAGWGTAGVIITDEPPSNGKLLPINGDGKTGVDFSDRNNTVIVTPYPKEFSWFATQLLNSRIDNFVELFSKDLSMAHLAFYTERLVKKEKSSYKIKDELIFLCNWFMKNAEAERAYDEAKK